MSRSYTLNFKKHACRDTVHKTVLVKQALEAVLDCTEYVVYFLLATYDVCVKQYFKMYNTYQAQILV